MADLDAAQLIKLFFDPTTLCLKVIDVGAASGISDTDLDMAEVLKLCHDVSTGKLRVVFV